MWVQGGFSPDSFWHQTPLHFQLAMKGVRKRLEGEAEARTTQAYEAGAFAALADRNKLKPLKTYLNAGKSQGANEMLSMLKVLGAKSDMQIKKVRRAND